MQLNRVFCVAADSNLIVTQLKALALIKSLDDKQCLHSHVPCQAESQY